ncbi:hypothetical protein IFM89_036745 [Coptis chinensis]|uniref:Uncharacterized protein n=1 Tax=Coptis chinensis TaxID=261450 RepID=A0A835I7Q5_9MAGN|nr:hypothetical protein IFM89_036745 [Coptis chinensis]
MYQCRCRYGCFGMDEDGPSVGGGSGAGVGVGPKIEERIFVVDYSILSHLPPIRHKFTTLKELVSLEDLIVPTWGILFLFYVKYENVIHGPFVM